MLSQSDLIGNHPASPNKFATWLACNDVVVTVSKRHRSLSPLGDDLPPDLIDWLARRIIHHHYDERRINNLKQKYAELGFPQYAEQTRKLPRADKVRKGNAVEVLLIEYVESCKGKNLIKTFKLRYNPNVDQAMKGDDTLMVELIEGATIDQNTIKIYLGESKFRAKADKAVVLDISTSLSKDKKPLSYTFLVDELSKDSSTEELAKTLDRFIIDEIKSSGNITYTGMLLSDRQTSKTVESHLNSDNPTLVFISLGLLNPQQLINEAFQRADILINNPQSI